MNLAQIPFDMSFSFADDLREVPTNATAMQQGVKELYRMLKTDASSEKSYDIRSTLGVYERIQNNLTVSKEHLEICLDYYSKVEDEIKILINKIRLAHTHQWAKDFSLANELLHQALQLSQSHPRFIRHQDFVLQHFGKLRYDQGLYREAEDFFNKALLLRQKKGIAELIVSTEFSLSVIKRLTF